MTDAWERLIERTCEGDPFKQAHRLRWMMRKGDIQASTVDALAFLGYEPAKLVVDAVDPDREYFFGINPIEDYASHLEELLGRVVLREETTHAILVTDTALFPMLTNPIPSGGQMMVVSKALNDSLVAEHGREYATDTPGFGMGSIPVRVSSMLPTASTTTAQREGLVRAALLVGLHTVTAWNDAPCRVQHPEDPRRPRGQHKHRECSLGARETQLSALQAAQTWVSSNPEHRNAHTSMLRMAISPAHRNDEWAFAAAWLAGLLTIGGAVDPSVRLADAMQSAAPYLGKGKAREHVAEAIIPWLLKVGPVERVEDTRMPV